MPVVVTLDQESQQFQQLAFLRREGLLTLLHEATGKSDHLVVRR